MKSLEILGAGSGEVTGSHNLLTLNSGKKIVVDYGLYQGPDEEHRSSQTEIDYDTNELEAVIVTHGHLDHIGGIPKLAGRRNYQDLPIIMTPATSEIMRIALQNASGLDPRNFPYKGIEWALKNRVKLPYGKKIQIDGANVSFKDAGHILGSATAVIEEGRGETAVFSGDLGNSPSITVKPFVPPNEASIVVMESTYGDKIHSSEDPKYQFKDALDYIDTKNGGTILTPTFSIDRAQMLLRVFKEMRQTGDLKKNIPVFLDSPMAIEITELYEKYSHLLNEELQEDQQPFRFSNLRMINDSIDSRRIRNHHGPKVIIAGSGMMSGGRIMRHAINFLPEKNTVISFVGYPAKGTTSRKIAVEESDEVEIYGKRVKIKAQVHKVDGLSAHADQGQLIRWFEHVSGGQIPVRKLILNHGENPQRQAFAEKVIEMGIEVVLPENGDKIDLNGNSSNS